MKRYNFTNVPKIDQLDASKVEFKQGVFNEVGIDTLAIYGDGVVITTKASTDVLDAFFEDLSNWMDSAFGLKRFETHSINRMYDSTLLVRSNARVLQALDVLGPIQELITKSLKATTGLDAKYEPFGISFAADHSLIPGLKPMSFRFERRGGLSFNTNYYLSQGPLRTGDHLKLLEKLEKMVS